MAFNYLREFSSTTIYHELPLQASDTSFDLVPSFKACFINFKRITRAQESFGLR